MQKSILFMLLALIAVTTCTIQNNSFVSSGEVVGLTFAYKHVTEGLRSRLHCAALCDQHSWCIALSWDFDTKTCLEFKRTLKPEVTPIFTFTTDKVLYIGNGYSYLGGMLIKFMKGRMSWNSAQNHCVQEGGRLVVLDTVEKYQAIKEVIKKDSFLYDNIWFVGSTKMKDTWTLTTGQALDPNIPVTEDQGETCLGYYKSFLDDNTCAFKTYFICEK